MTERNPAPSKGRIAAPWLAAAAVAAALGVGVWLFATNTCGGRFEPDKPKFSPALDPLRTTVYEGHKCIDGTWEAQWRLGPLRVKPSRF